MYSMPECGKGDHSLRVAAAAFGGSVQLIAADGTRMWHVARAGFEVHASPAIGHFGGIGAARGTPDVVFAMHKGVFPSYTSGLILWLDGTDGSVLHEHEGGHQIISSPVVIDINRDGIDDTIIVRDNEAMSSKTFFFADANSKASSSILIFDGMTGHVKIRRKIRGLAVATPALIALDVNYDGEVKPSASPRSRGSQRLQHPQTRRHAWLGLLHFSNNGEFNTMVFNRTAPPPASWHRRGRSLGVQERSAARTLVEQQ